MDDKVKSSKAPVQLGFLAQCIEDLMKQVRKYVDQGDEKQASRIAELEAQRAKDAETLQSFERRASRHAEHLARLETRMKAQETR